MEKIEVALIIIACAEALGVTLHIVSYLIGLIFRKIDKIDAKQNNIIVR